MRYNKKTHIFMCRIDHLDDEIKKCEKEKKRIMDELLIYKKIYDKAKREYESKINRIEVIDEFIQTARMKMNEEKKGNEV